MAGLDIAGVAYICSQDNVGGFTGRLITLDRHQYSIQGHDHVCDGDHHIDVDQHTCCFDESAQMMELTILRVDDFREKIIVHHVMKSGGDNFSLTSPGVEFVTDELLIGDKAASMAAKYISPQFAGTECLVCIGQMTIKFPTSSS